MGGAGDYDVVKMETTVLEQQFKTKKNSSEGNKKI